MWALNVDQSFVMTPDIDAVALTRADELKIYRRVFFISCIITFTLRSEGKNLCLDYGNE
jgi:hypothetical protein